MPDVRLSSALKPIAVLSSPVVLFKSASSPRTVLSLVKQPSWQVARACGESAKQTSTNVMRRNSLKGKQLFEFLSAKVVVFIWAEDCKNLADLARRIERGASN